MVTLISKLNSSSGFSCKHQSDFLYNHFLDLAYRECCKVALDTFITFCHIPCLTHTRAHTHTHTHTRYLRAPRAQIRASGNRQKPHTLRLCLSLHFMEAGLGWEAPGVGGCALGSPGGLRMAAVLPLQTCAHSFTAWRCRARVWISPAAHTSGCRPAALRPYITD